MNVLVPIENFQIYVREVTSLPASSKGNLAFLHKVTQCQLLTGSHFFIMRFELWIPMYPQDGTNLSHCAINNNSGPGIDSPTSHQNPGFRGPTVLVPLPTDDWQPKAERVTAGGRSQTGLKPNVVGQRFHPIQPVGGCSLHPGSKSS